MAQTDGKRVSEEMVEAAMIDLFGELNERTNYHCWVPQNRKEATAAIRSALETAFAKRHDVGLFLDWATETAIAETLAPYFQEGFTARDGAEAVMRWLRQRFATCVPDPTVIDEAGKAAFRQAQSVYRGDHDHFPLKQTWETTEETVRAGWRKVALAAITTTSAAEAR